MNRRNFLEWLAAAGAGSIGGFSFIDAPGVKQHISNHSFHQNSSPSSSSAEEKLSLHIFSKHLQFLNYKNMAEAAAEAGFEGVDLSVRPNGHVEPEEVERNLPKAVNAIRKAGLQSLMITTAVSDPANEVQQRTLKAARDAGIKFYRTNWLWYNETEGIEKNLQNLEQQLHALAEINQKLNITGDYQNHAAFSGYPFGAPVWDLAQVLKKINSPYLGCQYDIRHATVEGATSWPLGLKLIQPHIHTLVVKDFKWEKKDGKWQVIDTPIGEGMVDFPKFFSLLKEYRIIAPISVHFEYDMPEHNHNLSEKEKRRQTIKVMRKDVEAIKKYMNEAGL